MSKDISFRLVHNLRVRLGQAFLKQVTKKSSKIEESLGISIKEFKKYIEFLMTSEMSWDIALGHLSISLIQTS